MTREIEVECPSCSPEEEVGHEVMKEGQSPLVRCLECGQIHAAKIKTPKFVLLRVIVSKRDVSNTYKTELDSETAIQVDDELVVDDEETGLVYTSDAADDLLCVDLGGRRIIKKK